MLPRRCMASCRMKLKPVVYDTFWSRPHSSVAEFFIRFTPASVCTVVLRLPFTTPSYDALRTVSRIPASPMTINRRRTRKAVMRVASEVDTSAQIPTTTFVNALRSFRN